MGTVNSTYSNDRRGPLGDIQVLTNLISNIDGLQLCAIVILLFRLRDLCK